MGNAVNPQSAVYAGTPNIAVMDNRGLAIRQLQLNKTDANSLVDTRVTRTVYDVAGFAQTVTDPRLGELGAADTDTVVNFRSQYDLSGRSLHVDSADSGTSLQFFDLEGRVIWQRDGRETVTTFIYDALGRLSEARQQLVSESAPVLIAKTIYSDNDPTIPLTQAQAANLVGIASTAFDAAGKVNTTGMCLSGAPQAQMRQLLTEVEGDPDWGKNKTDQLEAQSYVTSWAYNALGMVLSQTDALGNVHESEYDVALQLIQSRLIQAGTQTVQTLLKSVDYNANGQVVEETTGNDVVTTYGYEPQTQRLIRIVTDRPDKDGTGRTRSARLQDLNYQYDPVGNIVSIQDAAQPTRFYHNRTVVPQSLYVYDALYQLIEATGRENADAGAVTTTDLQPIIPVLNDLSVLTPYIRHYQYDRGGNLTQIHHSGTTSYTRKIVVADNSNRAVMQNALESLKPQQISTGYFDDSGNSLHLQPGSQQPLSWDGRNALSQVTLLQRTQPIQSDREVYQYGANGQRVRKTTLRYKDNGQSCQRDTVLYLPGVEIRKSERLSITTPSVVPTVTEELHVISGFAGRAGVQVLHWLCGKPATINNDQIRYSFGNQIGSVTLELDRNASVLTFEEYYPYGGTAVRSAASQAEASYKFIRYSGKERDATGLYYYGMRYYQPWIGRWLNTDPAGTIDGTNLYRMVRNNPISLKDKDGRAPDDEGAENAAGHAGTFENISGGRLAKATSAEEVKAYKHLNLWNNSNIISTFDDIPRKITGHYNADDFENMTSWNLNNIDKDRIIILQKSHSNKEILLMEKVDKNIPTDSKVFLDIKIGKSTASKSQLEQIQHPSPRLKKVKHYFLDIVLGSSSVIGNDRGFRVEGLTIRDVAFKKNKSNVLNYTNMALSMALKEFTDKNATINKVIEGLWNIKTEMNRSDVQFVASSTAIAIDFNDASQTDIKLIDLAHPVYRLENEGNYEKYRKNFLEGMENLIKYLAKSRDD